MLLGTLSPVNSILSVKFWFLITDNWSFWSLNLKGFSGLNSWLYWIILLALFVRTSAFQPEKITTIDIGKIVQRTNLKTSLNDTASLNSKGVIFFDFWAMLAITNSFWFFLFWRKIYSMDFSRNFINFSEYYQ